MIILQINLSSWASAVYSLECQTRISLTLDLRIALKWLTSFLQGWGHRECIQTGPLECPARCKPPLEWSTWPQTGCSQGRPHAIAHVITPRVTLGEMISSHHALVCWVPWGASSLSWYLTTICTLSSNRQGALGWAAISMSMTPNFIC